MNTEITKKETTDLCPVTQWKYKSCTANIGEGEDWATIYFIESTEQGKGHATLLLTEMQSFYTAQGKEFGSSIALSPSMKHLLVKLNIPEYD